jgi:micrococcal nuclease
MQHRLRPTLLLLGIITLAVLGTGAKCAVGRVTHVTDGDTFIARITWHDPEYKCWIQDGGLYTIRLIGVDAPETVHPKKPVECYALEAAAFTKDMLEGRNVCLLQDVSCRDRYARLLAHVWVDTDPNHPGCETFLSAELVKQGYARVKTYPPDMALADFLKSLECQAYQAGLGLWGACDYPPPTGCGPTPTPPAPTPTPTPTPSPPTPTPSPAGG